MRILVQRHSWAIFLRKWARRGRYSQWRLLYFHRTNMLKQRWEVSLLSTYRICRFWQKNHLFRWSSFWSWLICKQAKLSHLGHKNPARIHWKADAPKTRVTVWCEFWSRSKWARRGRYSQWRSLFGHVEWIFVHKNWREGYCNIWFQQDGATCHTPEAALDVFHPVFEDY